QQSGLIPQRPSSGHLSRPDPGPATGQNHSSGLLGREAIPLFQHGAQTVAPVSSWRRNSSTKLLVTWERYLAVERMSLIGRISEAAVFLATINREESILFPFTAISVFSKRRGTGATLRAARRRSSTQFFASRPTAAPQTLEMACALRAPTLRA